MNQTTAGLYGINNCDTCRKARRWLDDRGANYHWHDIRRDGLTEALVSEWLTTVGTHRLINRRGRSWRELDERTRSALEAGDTAAFLGYPTVIKRPVLVAGDHVTVGFDPDSWASLPGI